MNKKHYKKFLIQRSLLIALLFVIGACFSALAETVTIAWDPNPEPDIYGYKVFYGTESRNYTHEVDVTGPTNTSVQITDLEPGNTYYFAVKAVDISGQESDFSEEVSKTFELPNVPPTADFTVSAQSGIAPVEITFVSTSSDSDGTIVGTQWAFGDGTTGAGPAIGHTFTAPGTYTVTMTVTDDAGAETQASTEIVVEENRLPSASIDMDTSSGFAPVEISVSAENSSDPDGSITQYTWEFGDGTTAQGMSTTHTYTSPGSYTVVLTVTDDKGGTDTETAMVEVKQGYTYTWVLGENSISDLTGTCEDTYLNKNSENYAEADTLRTYTWPTDTAANAIVMKWNLSTLPQDAEIKSASLELYLTDSGGDDPYEIGAYRLTGVDPVIYACTGETYDGTNPWTNDTPLAQDNISVAESTTAVDTARGFKGWDITDMVKQWMDVPAENYGVLLNPDTTASSDSFRYFASSQAEDQALRPKLTITFVSSQHLDLPPRAVAAADRLTGKAPLTVNFNAQGSHDTENSLSYSWNFGDGSANAAGMDTAHTFDIPGIYQVQLTVTDAAGQSDSAELNIEVTENQVPVASAQADMTAGEAPLTVLFDAAGSSDSDGAIVTYSWDFNSDGIEDAEGMTVEHTFTEAGQYRVTLTVTDDSGASARDTGIVIEVTDNNVPQISDFSVTPEVIENPFTQATFNATVSDPDNDPVTIHVDCGNGTGTDVLPAVCTYSQTGSYQVTLTADDHRGGKVSSTLTVQVNNKKPATPFNLIVTAK